MNTNFREILEDRKILLYGIRSYLNLFTTCLFRSISRIWAHWPPHAFPHFGKKGGKKETKRLLEQSIVRLATKSKLRETQTLTMIQVWPHTKLELNFLFRDAAT